MDDTCKYCGAPAVDRDHVPPKNLFPKPRPSNLVTVPACEACNKGASLDDEYFRLMLAIRHDTAGDAAADLIPKVHRSLENPQKRGMLNALIDSWKERDAVTESGIYLGKKVNTYDVDTDRLDNVVRRTVKGLYYNKYSVPFPASDIVKIYHGDSLDRLLESTRHKAYTFCEKATSGDPILIGDPIFAYWVREVEDHSTATVWVLLFFRRVVFLCLTHPLVERHT